jgi:hypothetical protein
MKYGQMFELENTHTDDPTRVRVEMCEDGALLFEMLRAGCDPVPFLIVEGCGVGSVSVLVKAPDETWTEAVRALAPRPMWECVAPEWPAPWPHTCIVGQCPYSGQYSVATRWGSVYEFETLPEALKFGGRIVASGLA